MPFSCQSIVDTKQFTVRSVRFNVDGAYCLTSGADRTVKLFNPYRGVLLKTYSGHGNEVREAVSSCDSSRIASCSLDKTVILWDVLTSQAIQRYRDHRAGVMCVAFNEDSSVVVSGGQDNCLMIYDTRSRKHEAIQTMEHADDCVTSIKIHEAEIITCSVDCKLRKYDVRNGSVTEDYIGVPLTCVSVSYSGQCVVVSCADNCVRLMDLQSGQMLADYKGHIVDDVRTESAVNPNDNLIVSGSKTGDVFVWDVVTKEVVEKFTHTPTYAVTSLHMHPTKDVIVTASGPSVKLWTKPEDAGMVTEQTQSD